MSNLNRRALIATLAALPFVRAAHAAQEAYILQKERSAVGFEYRFSGKTYKGSMPVKRASITIDFNDLSRSEIDIEVDVTRAKAGLIFATEALKSGSVLDAKSHPTIRFRSTRIHLNGKGSLSDGAKIDGLMTIKGTTNPISLNAALFRQTGSEVGDRSQLSFHVKGSVSRAAFGAGGYADLVKDDIGLNIVARAKRA